MAAVFKAFAPYRARLMDEARTKGWRLVLHPAMESDDPYLGTMTPQTI